MLCPLVRFQLSSALDRGGDPPRLARRHLAGCAGCTAHAGRLRALHAHLTAGADAAPPPPSMASPGRARRRWPALGGAAAAACAAALAIVALSSGGGERAAVQRDLAANPDDGSGARLIPAAYQQLSSALDRSPLEEELEALADDGARGVRAVLRAGGLQR